MAIHLAQWCNPTFAVQVTIWIEELLTTGKVEIAQPAAPPLPPWAERIRVHVIPFRHALAMRGDGRWAIVSEIQLELCTMEDVWRQHDIPARLSDQPDNSVGQYWPRERAGKPWARDIVKDTELTTPHGFLAHPALFHAVELPHFHFWFRASYLPVHAPQYLVNKAKSARKEWNLGDRHPTPGKLAQAADAVAVRLTGQHARLSNSMDRHLRLVNGPQQRDLFGEQS